MLSNQFLVFCFLKWKTEKFSSFLVMGEGKSAPCYTIMAETELVCTFKSALCLLCEEWVVMEQNWKKWKQRVYSGSTASVQVRGEGARSLELQWQGLVDCWRCSGVRPGSNCWWVGFEAERNRQMLTLIDIWGLKNDLHAIYWEEKAEYEKIPVCLGEWRWDSDRGRTLKPPFFG